MKEICDQNGMPDPDFYKNNVPQLAKFLLIKQRHPFCLNLYRRENVFHLENPEILKLIEDLQFKPTCPES